MRLLRSSLLLGCLATCAAASASFYQYDLGTFQAGASGVNHTGDFYDVTYLNRFVVREGGTLLTSIDLVWGADLQNPFAPATPNGVSAEVLLMGDPTNDGDPNDAYVIQSIGTVTQNTGTLIFNRYELNPIELPVGTTFFAGASLFNLPNGTLFAILGDSNTVTSELWTRVGPPGEPGGNFFNWFHPEWTWMVRVNAVPEPGTMIALAGGLALVLRRRRNSR